MPNPKKDLSQMAKEIEEVIKKHVGLKEKPGIVIAFTCEPTWDEVHWITNLPRPDAVNVLRETAAKMVTNSN